MSRLIDIDNELVRLDKLNLHYGEVVKYFLDTASTVDAEPVRHGKWIMEFDEKSQSTDWRCSACDKHGRGDYKRCPWCGAKMDGEKDE